LAAKEYRLEKPPLFATANRSTFVLFKGISVKDLGDIIDVKLFLEPKQCPKDWVKAFKSGGLEKLLNNIIDGANFPLRDDGVKRFFKHVGDWLIDTYLPPALF